MVQIVKPLVQLITCPSYFKHSPKNTPAKHRTEPLTHRITHLLEIVQLIFHICGKQYHYYCLFSVVHYHHYHFSSVLLMSMLSMAQQFCQQLLMLAKLPIVNVVISHHIGKVMWLSILEVDKTTMSICSPKV